MFLSSFPLNLLIISLVVFTFSYLNDSYELFISSTELIFQRYLSHTSIFSGNFNLPNICWSNDNSGLTYLSPNLRVPCVPKFFVYFGFFLTIYPILNSYLLNLSFPLKLIIHRYLYFVITIIVYLILQIRIHIIIFVKSISLVSLIL